MGAARSRVRDRHGKFRRRVDSLGRPVMVCCGALILDFRPFQCVHQHAAFRARAEQLTLGLDRAATIPA